MSLWLEGTDVDDLAPLMELESLAGAVSGKPVAIGRTIGLHYGGTPVARRAPFDQFIMRGQPACTIDTLNYLRRATGT